MVYFLAFLGIVIYAVRSAVKISRKSASSKQEQTTTYDSKLVRIAQSEIYQRSVSTYDDESYEDPSRPYRIDGRKVTTDAEWEQWWIIRDFTVKIATSLKELEEQIKTAKCDSVEEAYVTWNEFYDRLRNLCIRHSLWNPAIMDKEPFVPTEWQLKKEETLKIYVNNCYQEGLKREKEKQEEEVKHMERQANVLEYLTEHQGKEVVRHIMIDNLSQRDAKLKALYLQTCTRMAKENLISESKNSSGRITIKKRKQSGRSSVGPVSSLPPSTFDKSWYSVVPIRTIYKAMYTVGQPIDLDKEKNTAVFKSLSSLDVYQTSLSECTCYAFTNDSTLPCKHMVALAKSLGFSAFRGWR